MGAETEKNVMLKTLLPDHVPHDGRVWWLMCALTYYKALAIGGLRGRPTHVPVRVRLAEPFRGHSRTAPAGDYDCECDQWGLPLLVMGAGRIKIKLGAFDVLEWGLNPHVLKGGGV